MLQLIFENIAPDGNIIGRRVEEFNDVSTCLDRVDEVIDEDPRNIYASEYLLAKHGLPIPEEAERKGTSGWELRGVIDNENPDQAAKVAAYLGSIVDEEESNAKAKRAITLSSARRAALRRTIDGNLRSKQ